MNEYIFYVPLFHFKIKNWNDKKKKLINLYQMTLKEFDFDNSLYTNYHQNSYITTQGVTEIFYDEIELFLKKINSKECNVSLAWFEKSLKYGYHGVHNHGSIGYSSVCFIDYDEKEHTPTKFLSPFNNFLTGVNLIHNPPDVSEGSILFFPSAITHYTEPNVSEKARLIVSFNLNIK